MLAIKRIQRKSYLQIFSAYKNFNCTSNISNNTVNKCSTSKISNLPPKKAKIINYPVTDNNSSNVNSISLSRSFTESSVSLLTTNSLSSYSNSNQSFVDQNSSIRGKNHRNNTMSKKTFKSLFFN